MNNDKLEQLIKDSRKFLHDISNKLLINSGLGSHVLTALKNGKPIDAKLLDKLERAVDAANSMAEMVRDHRAYLVQVSTASTPSTPTAVSDTKVA
ncbi:MAG: hypothetical protein HQK50_18690 [Oligoflexia bacterium]|nr:hypothetical protein [Oligoflexia bacterium]MBF0367609.1 hypothetical protein [Oligoflexia bacterium]